MMNLAWHFVGEKLRDGRPVPPDGEWLTYEGPIVWCKTGLYASRHPFDALPNALGSTLCLVEVDQIEREERDKLACRRRRIVQRRDVAALLRDYACSEVLRVGYLWRMPEACRIYFSGEDRSESARVVAAQVAVARAAAAQAAVAWATAWSASRAAVAWARAGAEAAWAAVEAAETSVVTAALAVRPSLGAGVWATAAVVADMDERERYRIVDEQWAPATEAARERFRILIERSFST